MQLGCLYFPQFLLVINDGLKLQTQLALSTCARDVKGWKLILGRVAVIIRAFKINVMPTVHFWKEVGHVMPPPCNPSPLDVRF